MPLPQKSVQLTRMPTRDLVYRQLREWIVTGALRPGERLNYHELGQQLGVSFIPLREACLRLHHEGFVEMAHSRWTRVVALNPDEAAELCLAVGALEALALELAAPSLRPRDVRQLQVLNETLRDALEGGDAQETADADVAFHNVWVERTGNRKVAELLADLKARLRIAEGALFGADTQPPTSPDEHDAMIEALAGEQIAEAIRLLREHWRARHDRLRAAADPEPA